MENNIKLLKWYTDKTPIDKNQVDKLYHMFMLAYDECPDTFIDITLYIAGTRNKFTNTHYKLVLHFLATNYPETIMYNIWYIINFGHITDLLYLKQEPVISARINTFIKYNSKFNSKFKNIENIPYNFEKTFKFKLKKDNYNKLLEKIKTIRYIQSLS